MTTTQQLRQRFQEFFADKGHQVVPSASLVPQDDPTLLFVNAGMVPFKHVFLGSEKRGYTRAISVQRCIRAGGKHNDLENVGYTARHHTFFEMLGNFSFGDYFKREAIQYAWAFLTEVIKLPAEKLWITVFEEDQEAEDIWLKEIGVSPERFSRIGAKDNFWMMGDTGPCGPCTEIFYDHGPEIPGGPPGTPEEDGDRYVEIWNLVFMQYNRSSDGQLTPLPKPSVDTGMGFERLAAVVQGVHDNYHTDTFQHVIKAMAKIADEQNLDAKPLRVIADHIRSTCFLIADGVKPGNESRGYVLRRIMRRAIRYGHKLGLQEPFFYHLVEPLTEMMGEAYPELVKQQYDIRSIILKEEEQFARTLDQGLKILQADMDALDGKQIISGETVFKLYDTYGFPVDLTADIAREHDLSVDHVGFEECMTAQRERARAASRFAVDYNQTIKLSNTTRFVGYQTLQASSAVEVLLSDSGERVSVLEAGHSGAVVLETTPFYPEGGGQAGERGEIVFAEGKFLVHDTRKFGDAIVHFGEVIGAELIEGVLAEARVDGLNRQRSAMNHSATHLLHAALRKMLGTQVEQKGSSVSAERLRFDFSHSNALQWEELRNIEDLVNDHIRANYEVEIVHTSPEQAKQMGAVALFGEKYGDEVRVLKMGEFSMELCGGIHVKRTGDIGLFKILQESGIASGVRRIEAITGHIAVDWSQSADQICIAVADILNTKRESVADKLQQVFAYQKDLEKQLAILKDKLASGASNDLLAHVQTVSGVQVLAVEVQDIDAKSLRGLLDQLRQKLKSGIVLLGLKGDRKVNLIAGVTDDLTKQFKAGELVNHVAQQVGGKGGGRPDMAQAGGSQPEQLAAAIASVAAWVESKL